VMGADRRRRGVRGGRAGFPARAASAELRLVPVRPAAPSRGEPARHRGCVLSLRHADRPDHATARQGRTVAAPARGSAELLDRARSARAGARHDDQPVLTFHKGTESRMSFLKELVQFLMARKKYWLVPIFLVLFVFGGLIILVKGSAVAPFIYTLF